MTENTYRVRNAEPNEYDQVGQLMVQVYSQIEGFPNAVEQPKYYEMLAKIGDWRK
ncbi:hypothetical protein [Croceitalea rosinachiae]|uniref:Uncharacterized protein n=1 Tax=Croceitalea rosinachiae TaxID=3075596 RepID=A0ABU3A9K2_9FLAO|nr:hypothetical protein [Croceitalea sp. F388]MDT0606865.1 hypothetical protein [Croceitalea sp. F388]